MANIFNYCKYPFIKEETFVLHRDLLLSIYLPIFVPRNLKGGTEVNLSPQGHSKIKFIDIADPIIVQLS